MLIAAGVAGVVLLGGGAAYGLTTFLSGGGAQPEDVLPASTVAFAKVDFDPAANQKTALFSLMDKFPVLSLDEGEDLKTGIIEPLFADAPGGLDYQDDVASWVGDRMAIAGAPGADGDLTLVLAIAVTDEGQMTETFDQLIAEDAGGATVPGYEPFGYAMRGDYVLVTETQADADAMAAAEDSLAEVETYRSDLDSLDGDQIVVAWADLGAIVNAVPESAAAFSEYVDGTSAADIRGRFILGLHAEPDALEIQGRTRGLPGATSSVGEQGNRGLLADLPADAIGGLEVTGLGNGLVQAWGQISSMPEAAELTDAPSVGARVLTTDGDRAVSILDDILTEEGYTAAGGTTDEGYIIASDLAAAQALNTADGGLGDTDSFQRAVPDTSAGVVGYINIAKFFDAAIAESTPTDAAEMQQWNAIDAIGFSASGGADGGFTLRITTR